MSYLPLMIALLFCIPLAEANTLQGRVVGVTDGDTVTVLDEFKVKTKVRLAGIDAPEKSQAFGRRSKEHLSGLIFGKTVDGDWRKKDKYGRTVGKIFIDGEDANLEQIKSGFAWHYKAYEREQSAADRQSYSQAEIDARIDRLGIWQDEDPVAPWDFRRSRKKSAAKRSYQ